MVVVNDAKQLIGQRKPVVVTGALQTPTGRMVFARLENKANVKSPSRVKGQNKSPRDGERKPESSR